MKFGERCSLKCKRNERFEQHPRDELPQEDYFCSGQHGIRIHNTNNYCLYKMNFVLNEMNDFLGTNYTFKTIDPNLFFERLMKMDYMIACQ